jgi:hypothetical protein
MLDHVGCEYDVKSTVEGEILGAGFLVLSRIGNLGVVLFDTPHVFRPRKQHCMGPIGIVLRNSLSPEAHVY